MRSVSILRMFVLFQLTLASPAESAIFGDSNIIDIVKASSFSMESEAIAIAVLSANHKALDSKRIEIDLDSLDGRLCVDQPLAGNSSLSYSCTGFLVAPDLLVTAGHCATNVGETTNETEMYCETYQWLFGYQSEKGDGISARVYPMDDFYRCRKIVFAVREDSFPFRDYALIQLDRPVTGRRPLTLSAAPLSLTENLAMLGHPWGTPLKLTTSGKILINELGRQQFITNLDAFGGNSGSPVFDHKKEVVGILIGGTPSQDRQLQRGSSCGILNRCDEEGKNCLFPDKEGSSFSGFQRVGSEVQRIGPIIQMIQSMIRP